MNEPVNFLILLAGLSLMVIVAEMIKRRFDTEPKTTRVLIHIGVSILIFFAPLLFTSKFYPALLAVVFIVVNLISIKFGLFTGMNVDRKNLGTVYYPAAFLILVLLLWDKFPFVVSTSMLIMGLADPAAAIVGRSAKKAHQISAFGEHKTLEGASAMFLVSSASVLGGLVFFMNSPSGIAGTTFPALLNICIGVGVIAASVELISPKALDNLTVPLTSAFLLYIGATDMLLFRSFMLGELIALLVAFASYRLKLLTGDGAVATFILGSFIFGVGGWQWAIPILAFFVLGSGASRLFASRKASYNLLYEKSHTRDAGQVFANGGVALLTIIFSTISPDHHWYLAYVGSLTASTADTLATELGVFSRQDPFSIFQWRRVEKGMSGAVSSLGTVTGLVSAGMLAWITLPFSGGYELHPLRFVIGAAVSGVIGSFGDSIIGGTFQAQYECPKCTRITERRRHCGGVETKLISGYSWINNDAVNFAGSLIGALAFPLLFG